MPTECGPATSPAPRHQHPQELLMSLRKTALVAATAALSLASVGTASATTLNTDPGNVPFATGTVTFKNTSSGTATLTTALGNITCTTAHVQASANNNHAATLTGTLNQLTLTSCTDTIPLLTFSSCHLHGPTPGIRITSTDTTSGSVSIFDMTIRRGGQRRLDHLLHGCQRHSGHWDSGRRHRQPLPCVGHVRDDAQPHRRSRDEPHCDYHAVAGDATRDPSRRAAHATRA